jgi:hypothetical protein
MENPYPHPPGGKNPGCETVKIEPAESIQPLSGRNFTVSQNL